MRGKQGDKSFQGMSTGGILSVQGDFFSSKNNFSYKFTLKRKILRLQVYFYLTKVQSGRKTLCLIVCFRSDYTRCRFRIDECYK